MRVRAWLDEWPEVGEISLETTILELEVLNPGHLLLLADLFVEFAVLTIDIVSQTFPISSLLPF